MINFSFFYFVILLFRCMYPCVSSFIRFVRCYNNAIRLLLFGLFCVVRGYISISCIMRCEMVVVVSLNRSTAYGLPTSIEAIVVWVDPFGLPQSVHTANINFVNKGRIMVYGMGLGLGLGMVSLFYIVYTWIYRECRFAQLNCSVCVNKNIFLRRKNECVHLGWEAVGNCYNIMQVSGIVGLELQ